MEVRVLGILLGMIKGSIVVNSSLPMGRKKGVTFLGHGS